MGKPVLMQAELSHLNEDFCQIKNQIGFTSLYPRLNSHYEAYSYKKNKHKKIKACKMSVQNKPAAKRCPLIQIIAQKKALYRRKIPESSCPVRETVHIYILV